MTRVFPGSAPRNALAFPAQRGNVGSGKFMAPTPSPEPDETASTDDALRVDGFKGTPEEIERQWFREVYTGR
ncbi:MAG: hypothetical protein WCA95_12465, partial [Opitutaceae bacterium]